MLRNVAEVVLDHNKIRWRVADADDPQILLVEFQDLPEQGLLYLLVRGGLDLVVQLQDSEEVAGRLFAFFAAAIIFFDSATFIAIGFSQMTCLPALRASTVIGQCRLFGVQTFTASISGSASIFR